MRFQIKLIIASLVILTTALLINSVLSLAGFRQIYFNTLVSIHEVSCRNLKNSIEAGLKFGKPLASFHGMDRILRTEMEAADGLEEIAVVALDGTILYHTNPKKVGIRLPGPVLEPGDGIARSEDGAFTFAVAPLHDRGKTVVGYVCAAFSPESVRREIEGAILKNLRSLALILMVVFIGMSACFTLLVGNPIRRELLRAAGWIDYGRKRLAFDASPANPLLLSPPPETEGRPEQAPRSAPNGASGGYSDLGTISRIVHRFVAGTLGAVSEMAAAKGSKISKTADIETGGCPKIAGEGIRDGEDSFKTPGRYTFARLGLRGRIFLIAISFIVIGQGICTYVNYTAFRGHFIEALRNKAFRLGSFIESDVERIVGKGLPLERLGGLEKKLEELLVSVPELASIVITDAKDKPLFFAGQGDGINAGSAAGAGRRIVQPPDEGDEGVPRVLTPPREILDAVISLDDAAGDVRGFIRMRFSAEKINAKSGEVLKDMLVIIAASLLIAFEFLAFFTFRFILDPIRRTLADIRKSATTLTPLTPRTGFIDDLGYLIDQFNRFLSLLGRSVIGPTALARKHFALQHDGTGDSDDAGGVGRLAHARIIIFLFTLSTALSHPFFPLFVKSLYDPPSFGIDPNIVAAAPVSLYILWMNAVLLSSRAGIQAAAWKRWMVAAVLLDVAGHLLTFATQSVLLICVARSMNGAGFGLLLRAGYRLSVSTEARGGEPERGIFSPSLSLYTGMSAGTVLGGVLAEYIGFRTVFLISAAVSFTTLLFVSFPTTVKSTASPEFMPGSSGGGRTGKRSFDAGFGSPRSFDLIALTLFQAIPVNLVFSGVILYFTPLYLSEKVGLLSSDIGLTLTAGGLIVAFSGPIRHRVGNAGLEERRYWLLLGGLIPGLSLVSFNLASGFWPLMVAVAVLGFSRAVWWPLRSAYILGGDLPPGRGEASAGDDVAAFRRLEGLGRWLGPLLTALLVVRFGYDRAVTLLGGLLLVCGVLYILTTGRYAVRSPSCSRQHS